MRRLVTVMGLGLVVLAADARAEQITWNFNDDNAVHDTGAPSHFSISAFSIGNSAAVVGDPVNDFSPSSGTAGDGNLGNAVKAGALNQFTSSFFEVMVTPDAGYQLTLSDFDFCFRSTSTGPKAFLLASSADGFDSMSPFALGTIANNSRWARKDNAFSSIVFDAPVRFRLYAYGGAGAANSANFRLDDVTLDLSASPAILTPLPNSAWGGLVLLGGVAAARTLRRRGRDASRLP